jgi:hypothetical protein
MALESMTPAVPAQTVERSPGVPSVLFAALILALVKIGLKTTGFSRVLHWIRWRTNPGVAQGAIDEHAAVVATDRAVATAAALYPGRALCLEQSLALYYLLRRAGIGAQFKLGVQPYPFEGHAWVECNGRPVNDLEEHVRLFSPFSDIVT